MDHGITEVENALQDHQSSPCQPEQSTEFRIQLFLEHLQSGDHQIKGTLALLELQGQDLCLSFSEGAGPSHSELLLPAGQRPRGCP